MVSQYHNKPEADEGIASTVQGLLERGVITPWKSPWNTPIFPVQKPGTNKYRLVHDLRRINSMVVTPTLAVPNPYITVSNLTPAHQWFTCIDLANAFFCIPLSENVSHVWPLPTEVASTHITDCHKASSCHQEFLIRY